MTRAVEIDGAWTAQRLIANQNINFSVWRLVREHLDDIDLLITARLRGDIRISIIEGLI